MIEACTDWGVHERPPQPDTRYVAFADSAGGTGPDSFTLAVAHLEGDAVIVDVIRERKPRFVAADVVAEYAQLLRAYNISTVISDAFGGGFHSDEWARNDISFRKCEQNTSENYLRALPMLTSGRHHLADHATLRAQLSNLERRIVGGHETVSHPQTASAHDDVATAVCGVLVATAALAREQPVPMVGALVWGKLSGWNNNGEPLPNNVAVDPAYASMAATNAKPTPSHYLKSGQPETAGINYVGGRGRSRWGPI